MDNPCITCPYHIVTLERLDNISNYILKCNYNGNCFLLKKGSNTQKIVEYIPKNEECPLFKTG